MISIWLELWMNFSLASISSCFHVRFLAEEKTSEKQVASWVIHGVLWYVYLFSAAWGNLTCHTDVLILSHCDFRLQLWLESSGCMLDFHILFVCFSVCYEQSYMFSRKARKWSYCAQILRGLANRLEELLEAITSQDSVKWPVLSYLNHLWSSLNHIFAGHDPLSL